MPELWAGTDAGKAEHHCTAIDTNGKTVLSRRVPNNETSCWNCSAMFWTWPTAPLSHGR